MDDTPKNIKIDELMKGFVYTYNLKILKASLSTKLSNYLKENLNIDLSNQKPDEVGTNLAVQPVVDIEFRCDSTLIGALYVAEGAKLGARIILRALENRPDKDHLPLQYYKVAAKDSSWKSFGDTIECLTLENKIEADTCVAGAKATFDALIHCAEKMSKHSVT